MSFRRLLNHPAGPKTIYFYAPLANWALVVAGLIDMKRPADTISVNMAGALCAYSAFHIKLVRPHRFPAISLVLNVPIQLIQLSRWGYFELKNYKRTT